MIIKLKSKNYDYKIGERIFDNSWSVYLSSAYTKLFAQLEKMGLLK